MGRLFTAHIGINFAGSSNALRGCINDAKDLFRVFRPMAAASDILTEASARIADVRQFIAEQLTQLKAGDTLFLSRSSHGTQVPDRDGDEQDGKDEAFVCYGLDLLIDDEFRAILSRRAAGSFVVVFDDCCHSGTGHRFVGDADRPAEALARSLPWHAIPDECRLRLSRDCSRGLKDDAGVLHIAACQSHEVAWDGSRRMPDGTTRANGAGTMALLDALASGAKTWSDVFTGIASKFPGKYKQTPIASGDTSLLAMRVAGAVVPVVPPPANGGVSVSPPETIKLYWPGSEQGITYRRA